MARPTADRGRYSSRMNAAARTATRMLLLKPLVWRLLNVKVHGTEKLDNVEGAFVAFGNHSSHFDTPLIFGAMPRKLSSYMSAGAAADYWFDKWWKAASTSLLFNSFPVERPGKRVADIPDPAEAGKRRLSFKDASDKGHKGDDRTSRRGLAGSLLADGIPLLIFPEGTRSRTGAMGPFKPGTAALAISRGVPAIPVALVGAYAAWPATQKHLPRGRPEVHVVFGRPMHPLPGEIAHQFSERMRREVIELHDATARAYGMKTLAEYARTAAIERANRQEP